MKKSRIVSAFGWLFVGMTAFAVGDALAYAFLGFAFAPRILAGLALVLALPCFILWALGSLVTAAARAAGRSQAEALLQAVGSRDGGLLTQARGVASVAPLTTPALGRLCSSCQRNDSVVTCQPHRVELCAGCVATHFRQGVCSLAALSGVPGSAGGNGEEGARVLTSPLDLGGMLRR